MPRDRQTAIRPPPMKSEPDGYIPMKVRFLAWWQGVDRQVMLKRTDSGTQSPKHAVIEVDTYAAPETEARKTYYDWSKNRIELNTSLWGEGFTRPGGKDHAIDFVTPARLRSGHSILDFGAGLGGDVRAIAKTFDMWVDGLERNAILVARANEISYKLHMERLSGIRVFDPADFTLRPNHYHCIFGRDTVLMVSDKAKFLTEVNNGLKGHAHLIFAEPMLADTATLESEKIQQWIASEPEPVFPLKPSQYRSLLGGLRYEIRFIEDDSERFCERVMQVLKEFVEGLESTDLNRELVTNLMREAELWRTRIDTVESGELRYMRIHAIKKVSR